MVAIDADGGEIADPAKGRGKRGEVGAAGAEHRVAVAAGSDRLDQMGRLPQGVCQFVGNRIAVEDDRADARFCEFGSLFRTAGRTSDAIGLVGQCARDRHAGITGAKNQDMHRLTPAICHSDNTSSSLSAPHCLSWAASASGEINRDKAHTAIALTIGEVSLVNVLQAVDQAVIAGIARCDQDISDEAVTPDAFDRRAARRRSVNVGSSRVRRKASDGAFRSSRAFSFISDAVTARTCSRGRRRDSRRSHRCDCRSADAASGRSAPCARLSGRKCSAARRCW